jgi:hypothetical protein
MYHVEKSIIFIGYKITVFLNLTSYRSQNSSVGIGTVQRAERQRGRSSSPCEVKNFLFPTSSTQALGFTQTPIQWVPGGFSLGVKRPVSEADYSLPATAEVKKMWVYTSTPPYVFMG